MGTVVSIALVVGKFLWGLLFPSKTPEQTAHDAGVAEAERDNAVSGLQEVQTARAAEQDQRTRAANDPGRLRSDTSAPGASRPFDPAGNG